MPITYEIDPDEQLVYVTLPEKPELVESLEVMRRLVADERLGEGFGVLVDVRATKSMPTLAEARIIAEVASERELFFHIPTALVVSRPAQYGIGNMISIIARLRGAAVKAFYEVEEARAWLRGLPYNEQD